MNDNNPLYILLECLKKKRQKTEDRNRPTKEGRRKFLGQMIHGGGFRHAEMEKNKSITIHWI